MMSDLLLALSQRVFFSPSLDSAKDLYASYPSDPQVILKVETQPLVGIQWLNCGETPDQDPWFCRYNSGRPRCTLGRASRRGPHTFRRAHDWHARPSDVVEVTFLDCVELRGSVEVAWLPGGTWEPLTPTQ